MLPPHTLLAYYFRPLSGSYISQSGAVYGRITPNIFPSPIGELHFSIYQKLTEHSWCFFPSPIGELHFSICKQQRRTANDTSAFRPLSGSYISQSAYLLYRWKCWVFPSPIGELHFSMELVKKSALTISVSVPYRGATFLNRTIWRNRLSGASFPSPIGELHFSIEHANICDMSNAQFPSPIGELHFSIKKRIPKKLWLKFPSPIGELHFSIPSPQPHVLSGTNRGIAGEK